MSDQVSTGHNDYARTVDQYGTTFTDTTLTGVTGKQTFGPFDLRAFNGVAVTVGAAVWTIGTAQIEIVYMSAVNGGRDLYTRTFPVDSAILSPVALRSPTLAPACRVILRPYGGGAFNADVWIAGLTATPLGLLTQGPAEVFSYGNAIAAGDHSTVYADGYYAGDVNLYLASSVAGSLQYVVQTLNVLGYQVTAQAVIAGLQANVVVSLPAGACRLLLLNTGAGAINVDAYGAPAYAPPAT